jgi:DNA-binding transcriptional LysR family regulator
MLDPRKLRHIVTLAETASYARAAALLNISQPALSQSIQSIERYFGVRLEVAKGLGMEQVPTIRIAHLTRAQRRALALFDNKVSDMSEFDPEALARQLEELCAVDFQVELTGFSTAEIDILLETPTRAAGRR